MYAKHGFATLGSRWLFHAPLAQFHDMSKAVLRAPLVTDLQPGIREALPEEWHYIADMHTPPLQLVMVFDDENGVKHGIARLNPDMPGCMPFILDHASELLPTAVAAVAQYVDDKHEPLRLMVADPAIADACRAQGFAFRYEIVRMEKVLQ